MTLTPILNRQHEIAIFTLKMVRASINIVPRFYSIIIFIGVMYYS